MSEPDCPNIAGCRLVNDQGVNIHTAQRQMYIESYCHGYSPGYEACCRYITKKSIFFCPDFVLPDSAMTLDEILDKIESES